MPHVKEHLPATQPPIPNKAFHIYTISGNKRPNLYYEGKPVKDTIYRLMGCIMKCDIGKKIYYNPYLEKLYIESMEQYKRRLNN